MNTNKRTWYDKFIYDHPNFGIPNLIVYILIGIIGAFFSIQFINQDFYYWLSFDRGLIFSGQVWRVISFIFLPGTFNPLWFVVSIMFYLNIGRGLEARMSTCGFTLFYITGVFAAIISGMLTGYVNNQFLNMSLFLAFAYMYSDAIFNVWAIVPVKAKYLAIINVAFAVFSLYEGILSHNIPVVSAVLFSYLHFFLFFGQSLYKDLKRWIEIKKLKKNFKN